MQARHRPFLQVNINIFTYANGLRIGAHHENDGQITGNMDKKLETIKN